ncbi:hypothetical protein [Leeuwenhoekiella parthenopeia]|uniref:Uncharacterized protein n=1 Tax=Leeuwenhoekiella parthenopeia TaxID=2890320 RepID=A0ABS8GRA3_9FLAO|nr:hypothetical protein [Leeuwenhoekiella parthenopeia]MCC4212253.1 hypothetical protein [Leeuwenhoekiella parthenopeia]
MKEPVSNKTEPLRFFDYFINKESLLQFEKHFFDYLINSSQVCNKSQGYIEYIQPTYEKGYPEKTRIYIKDELQTKIRIQGNISLKLLKVHKNERLYVNDESNQFIDFQLERINTLIDKSKKLPYKEILSEELHYLYSEIEELKSKNSRIKKKPPIQPFIGNNPFFGNKSKASRKTLSKVYDVILDLEIIDEVNTTEEDFINILTDTNPILLKSGIFFIKDNYHSIFFINVLSKLFDGFTNSKIAKSQSFYSKGKVAFTQRSLDKYNTLLKQRSTKKYQYIENALKDII